MHVQIKSLYRCFKFRILSVAWTLLTPCVCKRLSSVRPPYPVCAFYSIWANCQNGMYLLIKPFATVSVSVINRCTNCAASHILCNKLSVRHGIFVMSCNKLITVLSHVWQFVEWYIHLVHMCVLLLEGVSQCCTSVSIVVRLW